MKITRIRILVWRIPHLLTHLYLTPRTTSLPIHLPKSSTPDSRRFGERIHRLWRKEEFWCSSNISSLHLNQMPSTVVYRKSIFVFVWYACTVKALFRIIIIIYFNCIINVTIYLFLRFCFFEISFHEKYFLISYLKFYIWITFHEKRGIFLKTKLNKMFVIYQIHQFHLLTSCNYYLLNVLNP